MAALPTPAKTGGTPAPVQRARAGAQALGAPRYLNRASGKMETAKAMRAFRPSASHALSHPVPHPNAPAQVQSKPSSNVFNLETASPQEITKYSTNQVQQEGKANLLPFQQKARDIAGTEQTVAKRYGGYGQATDSLLAGLQQGAAGSAKTFENQAAESALKAQAAVPSLDVNMDPQLKAQLEAERGNVAGIGAAAQATAGTLGQSETNFLTNLRAAAAQRVTEGQGTIASDFNKQRAQVQGKEQELLARQPGQITKLSTDLLQKQFADRTAEQATGIKLGQLGVAQQNAASKTQTVVNNRRSAIERTQSVERGHGIAEQKNLSDAEYKNKTFNEKVKYDAIKAEQNAQRIRQVAEKHSAGKPIPPAQLEKLSSELGTAYRTIEIGRSARKGPAQAFPGGKPHEGVPMAQIRQEITNGYYRSGGKSVKINKGPILDQVVIKAAEELWNTHKVSPQTRKLLGDKGMNIGTDAEAFSAVR